MLTESAAHKLLWDLCVKLGFCLSPAEQTRLKNDPPADVQSFTDAVFVAEGLDPILVNDVLYRQVKEMVVIAFDRAVDSGQA